MSNHTLSVLVSDQPGVLARVASLFSRRGFNIESLAVGPTERDDLSRITLVTEVDDVTILEQLVKQLNKLIEVYKVIELEPNSVQRQLILVKVRCNERNRSAVLDVVGLFRGKAVDVSFESITVEATGSVLVQYCVIPRAASASTKNGWTVIGTVWSGPSTNASQTSASDSHTP